MAVRTGRRLSIRSLSRAPSEHCPHSVLLVRLPLVPRVGQLDVCLVGHPLSRERCLDNDFAVALSPVVRASSEWVRLHDRKRQHRRAHPTVACLPTTRLRLLQLDDAIDVRQATWTFCLLRGRDLDCHDRDGLGRPTESPRFWDCVASRCEHLSECLRGDRESETNLEEVAGRLDSSAPCGPEHPDRNLRRAFNHAALGLCLLSEMVVRLSRRGSGFGARAARESTHDRLLLALRRGDGEAPASWSIRYI